MLTITPLDPRTNEARLTIPADITPADRARLDSLAAIFGAHFSRPENCYVMTELRGHKCFQLYEAGFSGLSPKSKNNRVYFTHPNIKRLMHAADAMKIAKTLISVRNSIEWSQTHEKITSNT